MLLSVFWLTTFSHLCDVTRTHFGTKAHWVTSIGVMKCILSFGDTSIKRFGEQTKVAGYGKKSFVYSGVNPYPHPIYINNPLSFLRKVKHHYHLWSCLTCREHTAPAFCKHSVHNIRLHQWPFILQAYHVTHMGLGEKTAYTFTYHHWWRDMQFRTGPTSWEYVPCEIKLKLYPFRKFVHVPSTYVRLLKICNIKFIPPKNYLTRKLVPQNLYPAWTLSRNLSPQNIYPCRKFVHRN